MPSSSSPTHSTGSTTTLTDVSWHRKEKKLEKTGKLVEIPLEETTTSREEEAAQQEGAAPSGTVPPAMQPDDLFDLTMCSEEAKQQVPSMLLGLTRITFHDGQFAVFVSNRDFETDETKIEIDVTESQKSPGKLKRLANFFRHRMLQKLMDRKINGVDYQIEKCNSKDNGNRLTFDGLNYRCLSVRKKFTIFSASPLDGYKDVLHHLFDIFPNEAPLFHVDLRGIADEQVELIGHVLAFEQIRECRCLAMAVRSNEFVATAHKIMELMTELSNLFLDYGRLDTEFFSPRMCTIDHLTVLYNKNVISAENLVSFDCETIKLWCPTVTAEALNQFVKQWMGGANGRLQCLEIPILYCEHDENMETRVLEGVLAEQWDELRRSGYYRTTDWNYEYNCSGKPRHVKCQRGWDVMRPSDGLLATILVNPSFFYFLVWHERFPEPPEDHIPFYDDQ